MKIKLIIFFLFATFLSFSQKKVIKRFELQSNTIAINTNELDNLSIENSNSNFVEVILLAKSYDNQLIKIKENEAETAIGFYLEGTETREVIFRKFITKRLQRAEAIIKLPKNIEIFIHGENVDIQSKNCKNKLSIYIDNGIVTLNTIQKNTIVKLYAGNVFASLKNINIDINSNLGKIESNGVLYKKNHQKKVTSSTISFSVETIKGNVFLREY